MATISQISSLQLTLNTAIDAFKAELAAQNLSEPSLTQSQPHPLDDLTYLPSPTMYEARRAALATMGQLKLLIQSPQEPVFAMISAAYEIASVGAAVTMGLSDILANSADPENGTSIEEVAVQTKSNPPKLERVLRLLVSQGWYRETKPRYFANNRTSNMIKKDQPGWNAHRYLNPISIHISEKLGEYITHPDLAFRSSTDPTHSAFNLAYNTTLPFIGANSWMTTYPDEALKWNAAMSAYGVISDAGVTSDFPWIERMEGLEAIVDVGGGQGTLCCALATKYPEIKHFIVQDVPETRPSAEPYINSKGLSDRVKFEGQDFFKPQQRRGKYLFTIQRVLHDWSDEDGAHILAQLRDVLDPASSILIIDTIIESGTVASSGPSLQDSLSKMSNEIYAPCPPPPFVPADYGDANRVTHGVNVILTAMCNSFERTLPQMITMVERAGLKVKKVYPTRGWPSIMEVVLPEAKA